MKEKIFELIKTNLKNPKLYIGLFVVFVIVLLLFPYIDANYFYYSRVEKRIDILDKVTEMDKEVIQNNIILKEEYNSILNEISKQKDGSLGSVFVTKSSNEVQRYKFLSGALLSWIVAIICLFVKMEKWWYKLFGLLIFGLIGGGIGYISMILPTVISPMCNYIIMPILQCILFGMLITGGNESN